MVSPKRRVWSSHSLKLEEGPQLYMGTPRTYSSASKSSWMNSVERARRSFCSGVREGLGVWLAKTQAASMTGNLGPGEVACDDPSLRVGVAPLLGKLLGEVVG